MADWIRSPKQRWFTNANWRRFAFESARRSDAKWNTYYGQFGLLINSKGIKSKDPVGTQKFASTSLTLCDFISSCPDAMAYLCAIASQNEPGCCCGCCDICCKEKWTHLPTDDDGNPIHPEGSFCYECEQVGGNSDCISESSPELPAHCRENPTFDCDAASGDHTADCIPGICNKPADCPTPTVGNCLAADGTLVDCSDENALCDPCGNSSSVPACDDCLICPCGDGSGGPGTDCELRCDNLDVPCPAICCIPGEEGCVECCPNGGTGCGIYVPEGLCCESGDCSECDQPGACCPYGYAMPAEYCEGCEHCNNDSSLPQCGDCPQCDSGVYVEDIDDCTIPPCTDFSSNCYSCGDVLIPIWFECPTPEACPNPYNPDCSGEGEEIVCYEYNSNDPIYYNASSLGPSVIIEYPDPTTGQAYSYGNVATLCEIPDYLQLCVYLVTADGSTTLLNYDTDYTINVTQATVTINSGVSTSGATLIRMSRCTDDKKMFVRFTEGAKLSANDLNASLHQLLFLIQEKEFSSNTYYQVENAVNLFSEVTFEINSLGTAATATITCTDSVTYDKTITIISTDGTSRTYTAKQDATGSDLHFDGDNNPVDMMTSLKGAIESSGGHAGKITCALEAVGGGTDDYRLVLTQATAGTAGNTTITEDLTNTTATNFTGGAINLTHFDGKYFDLIQVPATGSNVTKRYRFDSTSGGTATGALINTSEVCIQIYGLTTEAEITAQIKAAINNVTNGHGTTISVSFSTKDLANDQITFKQTVGGPSGNTAIAHDASLESYMYTGNWQFTGGVTYDQTNPMFTFSPPVSLPVNFNLASVQQFDVMAWNGNGSFTGRSPEQIAGQMQFDNLANVDFGTVTNGDIPFFNGTSWKNVSLSTKITEATTSIDLANWLAYTDTNAALNDYIYTGDGGTCSGKIDTAWESSNINACVNTSSAGDLVNRFSIPNTFTAFGLGYWAAEKNIKDQLDSSVYATSDLRNYISNEIGAGGVAGEILASFRWEISKTEGRTFSGTIVDYPRAYFDIRDFDYLGMTETGTQTASEANRAYYFPAWTTECTNCKNKVYRSTKTYGDTVRGDIGTFVYSQAKSRPGGLGPHKMSGSAAQGVPTYDKYLDQIKSNLSKKDWGTSLGYTETHPLTDYPGSGTASIPNFYSSMIKPYYMYNTNSNSLGNQASPDFNMTASEDDGHTSETTDGWLWNSTKDVPMVVTYYLGQLWNSDSNLNSEGSDRRRDGVPSILQWEGNIDVASDLASSGVGKEIHTDNIASNPTGYDDSISRYLGNAGNYWFYYKWYVTGHDSNTSGSPDDPSAFETISHYNPLDNYTLGLDSDSKYTILPAVEGDGGSGVDSYADDKRAAILGGYSYLVEANRAFSNLDLVMPDFYDEFVFEVASPTGEDWISGSGCDDGQCYEVVAKIEKSIDGCTNAGDTNCTKVGTSASENDGYHVYPEDFDADVVRAWEAYPYDKMSVEVRNKRTGSFDLVLKVPRLKRIGVIDIYMDDDVPGGTLNDYHQLSLDFLTNYDATKWDAEDDANVPESGARIAPPDLQDMELTAKGAAAFRFETAVQFIRLGIPSNIRVSFHLISTPQSEVFSD